MLDDAALGDFHSREHKKAKTKLALVAAAAQKIEGKPLEAVSVKEICDAVNVSETTFYNYFSKKSELIALCVQLWNMEIQLRAAAAVQGRTGLVMIGEMFEQVARHVHSRPGLTGEIIAFMAKCRDQWDVNGLTLLEKQIAFPEFPNIEAFEPTTIDQVLERNLRAAVEKGELPPHTKVEAVAAALASIFFGAPIAFRSNQLALNQVYRRQLNLVWLGVRGTTPSSVKQNSDAPSLYQRRAEP